MPGLAPVPLPIKSFPNNRFSKTKAGSEGRSCHSVVPLALTAIHGHLRSPNSSSKRTFGRALAQVCSQACQVTSRCRAVCYTSQMNKVQTIPFTRFGVKSIKKKKKKTKSPGKKNVSSLLKNIFPGDGYLKKDLEISAITTCLCRFTWRTPL